MGLGRDSSIGWVEEVAWGTAVTPPTKFAELVSEGAKAIRLRTPRPVVRDLDAREGNLYDEKFGASGNFIIEGNYEGMLRLLEHVFGSVATVGDTPEVGAHEHTFNLVAGSLMPAQGLTIYKNAGIGASAEMRYFGSKIRSMKFSFDPTRNMQVDVDFVAKDVDQVSENSPTFPDIANYIAGHQTTVEFDDVTTEVDSLELTIDNGLDDDKRILGSKQIDEPDRGDSKRVVSGTLTKDATNVDFTKYEAGTLFKLEVICAGPIITGAAAFAFNLTALKCEVMDDPIAITGPGVLKATMPFRVLKPTSGNMLSLLNRNSEAAVA